jgi:hypothetical protein
LPFSQQMELRTRKPKNKAGNQRFWEWRSGREYLARRDELILQKYCVLVAMSPRAAGKQPFALLSTSRIQECRSE